MEILDLEEPTWSRNYGDADDSEDSDYDTAEEQAHPPSDSKEPMILWEHTFKDTHVEDAKVACDLLLVCMKPLATASLFAHLSQGEKSAQVACLQPVGKLLLPAQSSRPNVTAPSQRSPTTVTPPASTLVYRCKDIEKTVLVVACNMDVPEKQAFAWADTLCSSIAPRRVVVCDTFPTSATLFTAETSDDARCPPRLFALKTTALSDDLRIRHALLSVFEPPNMVTGAGAALLTQCEIFNWPAQYIISLEGFTYEFETMKSFQHVWTQLPELEQVVQQIDGETNQREMYRFFYRYALPASAKKASCPSTAQLTHSKASALYL